MVGIHLELIFGECPNYFFAKTQSQIRCFVLRTESPVLSFPGANQDWTFGPPGPNRAAKTEPDPDLNAHPWCEHLPL